MVCRSGANYYERLVRGVRDADEITVQNLKPAQIIGYIQTQFPDELSRRGWQPVFDALTGQNPRQILSVLDTPCATAAVTFALSGGDPATLLPAPEEMAGPSWHSEYSRRISRLLMETFVSARISIHSKRRKAVISTIAKLRIVANFLTKMESKGDGGKEIILHQWWKAVGERRVMGFQLFAIVVFLQLPLSVLGFLPEHYSAGIKGLSTLIAIMVNFVTIILFSSYYAGRRKGPVTLHIRSLRSPDRVILTAIGIVYSGITGVLGAITEGPLYGIGYASANVALILLISASYGLDPVNATRPTATLVNDRNFAIIIGIAIGAYATLYYVPLYGLAVALVFASMCLLGSVMSSFYTRYVVAVYLGGFRGLPFRFAAFLNWCHSAGILRVSGIGYQFRHQELLDYLAEPKSLTGAQTPVEGA